MRSATPAFFTAAIESPPPMIVVPFDARRPRARRRSCRPRTRRSRTRPSGRSRRRSSRRRCSRAYAVDRRRADVDAHADRRSRGSSIAQHLVRRAGLDLGRRRRDRPAARAARRAPSRRPRSSRAASSLSSSTSDLPTGMPRALKNVYAIAPPMSSRSTLPSRFSITSILSDTFAPPRIATNGRSGDSSAWPRYSQLLLHQQAGGRLRQVRA